MKKKRNNLLFMCIIIGMLSICLGVAEAADRPLRMVSGWPALIDPGVGSDSTALKLFVNIYETLVSVDKNTGLTEPFIAKSWDITDNGKSWIFHLQEGVKFHDGTELTAEDVKFSMDRLTTIGEGFAFLFLNRVISTEVIDRYTVTFLLKKPVGPFSKMLCNFYVLNKDLVLKNIKKPGPYGDMGDYGKEWLTTHDAGSGPYMVKEYLPTESITLIVNPNYWRPLNDLAPDECIVYNITEPSTLLTMFKNREIEIGYHQSSKQMIESAEKIEGVSIKKYPQNGVYFFMINNKKPPTDDIHFRKAMAWGIDYKTIEEKIFIGMTKAKGPVPKGCPGFDNTILEYNYDLGKAKEELKKSKYYNELDKYPVYVTWLDRVPDQEKAVLLLMNNMAELGIKIIPVKEPWTKTVQDTSKLETSPAMEIIPVKGDYLEAGTFLENRYTSEAAPTWSQIEWLLDPELDARIYDAVETIDQNERFAKYSKILHYLNDDLCASISLLDLSFIVPYQSAYVDWPGDESTILMPFSEYYLQDIKVYPEKRLNLLKK